MANGHPRHDRTGVGTRSVFGRQIRFDLTKGFPLLTTKKVFTRGIIEELLWFLKGSTNAQELEDKGVNIWREWGDPVTRELGPVYGKQWRQWESPESSIYLAEEDLVHDLPGFEPDRLYGAIKQVDQINELIYRLRSDPYSRRHLVVAWNPGEVHRMALPPCHCLFQFFVRDIKDAAPDSPKYYLDCQLYQRSADSFLGVPFNIASYSLLCMMIAQQLNMLPGEFVHSFGDLHLYNNHVEQAELQLSREIRPSPTMRLPDIPPADIFSYTLADFRLEGYDPHPTIKASVAV